MNLARPWAVKEGIRTLLLHKARQARGNLTPHILGTVLPELAPHGLILCGGFPKEDSSPMLWQSGNWWTCQAQKVPVYSRMPSIFPMSGKVACLINRHGCGASTSGRSLARASCPG